MLKTLHEQDAINRGDMKVAATTSQNYETTLVERLRSGDDAAVKEFYDIYKDRLYSLILGQVDRDHAVTEDLVQEVFLAALSSLDKFRGDSQLYTWLRSIALHKINDFYRRRAREPKPEKSSPDFDTTKQLEQSRDNEPATYIAMESEETRQSIHQALGGLPQDYQEVLVLKYLEDMPVLQISRIMGRSPKSVEGLLARARKAMRAELEEDDDREP